MTAEPNEPVEPPQDDAADLPLDPSAGATQKGDEEDDDPETDAMGINDDDPIDRTLVGKPVDADEEPHD